MSNFTHRLQQLERILRQEVRKPWNLIADGPEELVLVTTTEG